MKRRWQRTALAAAAMAMAAMAAAGCDDDVRIGEPSEGEDDIPCTSVADCEAAASACRTAVGCERGWCVFADAPAGTVPAEQVAGDCVELVCDGAGRAEAVPLASDAPDDGDACTLDECVGTTPQHTPQVGGACVCVPGTSVPCTSGPPETAGVGACVMGTATCADDGLSYEACTGERLPEAETCDAAGVDEDCDGLVNEEGENCTCGDGIVSAELGEGCDDGNADSTDACTATCEPAACGDGFVQEVVGESCDDGGTSDGDRCSPTCEAQEVLGIAAFHHTCAFLSQGAVKCWGANGFGQLGLGDTTYRGDDPGEMGDSLPTVDLGSGHAAVALSLGHWHSCALLSNGSVKCWGQNSHGQLGLGDAVHRGDDPGEMGDSLPAVDLGSGKTAVALSLGQWHTCALLNDGAVKCWGDNSYEQLGVPGLASRGNDPGEMGDDLPAVNLGSGKTAVALSTKEQHTCARLNDGSVKCWGKNNYGQLGLGDTVHRGDGPGEMGDGLPAVNLGTGKTAIALSLGQWHTCALLNDGSVKCWGHNTQGQLGLGDTVHRGDGPGEMGDDLPAVNLGTGKTAVAIACANYFTCALLNDSSVKCWGMGGYGLGLGDLITRGDGPGEMGDGLPAVNLGTGKTAVGLAAGSAHVCVRLDDGSAKCWGYNLHGQLGLGDTEHRGGNPSHMGDALPTVKLFSPLW